MTVIVNEKCNIDICYHFIDTYNFLDKSQRETDSLAFSEPSLRQWDYTNTFLSSLIQNQESHLNCQESQEINF